MTESYAKTVKGFTGTLTCIMLDKYLLELHNSLDIIKKELSVKDKTIAQLTTDNLKLNSDLAALLNKDNNIPNNFEQIISEKVESSWVNVVKNKKFQNNDIKKIVSNEIVKSNAKKFNSLLKFYLHYDFFFILLIFFF
jgi:hypothetical protein